MGKHQPVSSVDQVFRYLTSAPETIAVPKRYRDGKFEWWYLSGTGVPDLRTTDVNPIGFSRERRMSNSNWVCFDCREAVRRPTRRAEAVLCPQCGRDCVCLGTKIRIPPKNDRKSWRELSTCCREGRLAALERIERMRVRRRHRLERQIVELESRPANERQIKEIRILREQLATL